MVGGDCMKTVLKKWKVLIVCLTAIIFVFIIFIFYSHNKQVTVVKHIPDNSTAKIVGDYLDEDDLIKAPYILEGTVTDISPSFEYGGIPFVKITFHINDILYSQSELKDSITILREQEMFTPLEKNRQYILYLYDYEGPIASQVKMICGGNLGAYEIVKEEVTNASQSIEEYKQEVKKALK